MDNVVYGLEDPRDHMYHYIGITDDVYARFNQHVTGSSGNVEKNGWIWECRQANIMILMRELQRMESREEAQERERFWIAYYLQLGHPLHNLAIAKGIVKEQAVLEQRLKRLEERLKELEEKTQPTVHEEEIKQLSSDIYHVLSSKQQQGLDLYANGKTSHREIAAIMHISESEAYRILVQLDAFGYIQRRKLSG